MTAGTATHTHAIPAALNPPRGGYGGLSRNQFLPARDFTTARLTAADRFGGSSRCRPVSRFSYSQNNGGRIPDWVGVCSENFRRARRCPSCRISDRHPCEIIKFRAAHLLFPLNFASFDKKQGKPGAFAKWPRSFWDSTK